MDNSIQQIINTLSNEIIQLKYKNETNVTMRIDTIIEFLEQLKTDIIEEQQGQKFDLHRTATNCTITILDEDNHAITDGSNKLSYGDVIKISVSANTHYENATLSVNGVAFTSGNTLVVKNDLYITGVATGVPYDLSRTATNCTITVLDSDNEPITDGEDKINYGDTIKISVEASEGYENPTLSVNGASFTSGNTMTVAGDVVIVGSASAIPVVTTITFTISDNGTYQAESGMKWSEWCDSAYNTDGWVVDGSEIVNSSFTRKVKDVVATDVIVDNTTYTTQIAGG